MAKRISRARIAIEDRGDCLEIRIASLGFHWVQLLMVWPCLVGAGCMGLIAIFTDVRTLFSTPTPGEPPTVPPRLHSGLSDLKREIVFGAFLDEPEAREVADAIAVKFAVAAQP